LTLCSCRCFSVWIACFFCALANFFLWIINHLTRSKDYLLFEVSSALVSYVNLIFVRYPRLPYYLFNNVNFVLPVVISISASSIVNSVSPTIISFCNLNQRCIPPPCIVVASFRFHYLVG
jgi:hypothetical protein